MKFTGRKPLRSDFEVVVTSMLDINFLLVMFFMMTAHFQRDTHAQLDLPKERGEADALVDEAGLVINVTAGGDLIVSGKAIDLPGLQAMVRQQADLLLPEPPTALKLMIRADRSVSTQHLNRVVSMLREQGVGTIRIATEIPL